MKEKKQRATKRGTKSEGIFPHRHNGEELIVLSNGRQAKIAKVLILTRVLFYMYRWTYCSFSSSSKSFK